MTTHRQNTIRPQTLAAGDSDSFSRIYNENWSTIYYFTRRFIQDPQQAENITAETFAKLWQEAEKSKMVNHVTTFLHTTAKNNCLDQLKTEKTHQEKHKEIAYLEQENLRIAFNTAEIKATVIEAIYSEIENLPTQ